MLGIWRAPRAGAIWRHGTSWVILGFRSQRCEPFFLGTGTSDFGPSKPQSTPVVITTGTGYGYIHFLSTLCINSQEGGMDEPMSNPPCQISITCSPEALSQRPLTICGEILLRKTCNRHTTSYEGTGTGTLQLTKLLNDLCEIRHGRFLRYTNSVS